jgi:hypothetical protein
MVKDVTKTAKETLTSAKETVETKVKKTVNTVTNKIKK